jgi:hypothetical protein
MTGVSKDGQQKCGPKGSGKKRQTIIWLLRCPFQLMFVPFCYFSLMTAKK